MCLIATFNNLNVPNLIFIDIKPFSNFNILIKNEPGKFDQICIFISIIFLSTRNSHPCDLHKLTFL